MAGSGASRRPVIMCLVEKGVQPIARLSLAARAHTRCVVRAAGLFDVEFCSPQGTRSPGVSRREWHLQPDWPWISAAIQGRGAPLEWLVRRLIEPCVPVLMLSQFDPSRTDAPSWVAQAEGSYGASIHDRAPPARTPSLRLPGQSSEKTNPSYLAIGLQSEQRLCRLCPGRDQRQGPRWAFHPDGASLWHFNRHELPRPARRGAFA